MSWPFPVPGILTFGDAIAEPRKLRALPCARIAELSPHYARKYKSFTLDPKMGPIFEVRPKVVFGLREKTFKAATRWTFS